MHKFMLFFLNGFEDMEKERYHGRIDRGIRPGFEINHQNWRISWNLSGYPLWLVVSTPLKNISQWEGLSHIL